MNLVSAERQMLSVDEGVGNGAAEEASTTALSLSLYVLPPSRHRRVNDGAYGPFPWLEYPFRLRQRQHQRRVWRPQDTTGATTAITTLIEHTATESVQSPLLPGASQDPEQTTAMSGDVDHDEYNDGDDEDCILRRVRYPSEVVGQTMDDIAKGILHLSATYFGPALIHLATKYAKQHEGHGEVFFGLKPSSLLTYGSVISSVVTALTLPLLGAVIDQHPQARKVACAGTVYLLALMNFSQMLMSSRSVLGGNGHPAVLFLFWLSYAFSDIVQMLHHVLVLAFIQDLTSHPDVLSTVASHISSWSYGVMTIYMVFMIAWSHFTQTDIVITSQVAHALSLVIGLTLVWYAWTFLFHPRGVLPPVSTSPPPTVMIQRGMVALVHSRNAIAPAAAQPIPTRTTTLRTWLHDIPTSFRQLRRTWQTIRQQYPALKWFLLTLLFCSNLLGSGSMISIDATLQKALLHMSSTQIGCCNLIILLFLIAGTRISAWMCQHTSPLISFQTALAVAMVATASMAAWVRGPAQTPLFIILASVQGATLGWVTPTSKVLFCTLTPAALAPSVTGPLEQHRERATLIHQEEESSFSNVAVVTPSNEATGASSTLLLSTGRRNTIGDSQQEEETSSLLVEQCVDTARDSSNGQDRIQPDAAPNTVSLDPSSSTPVNEMMGWLVAASTAMAWLPPLVFATATQAGYGLQYAVASQVIFMGIALLCSLGMGSYDQAVQQVQRRQRHHDGTEAPHMIINGSGGAVHSDERTSFAVGDARTGGVIVEMERDAQ